MQFGQLISNGRRWGALAAPRLSRFGHTATNVLSRVGDVGRMVASTGGQLVDAIDRTPIGMMPEAAAVLGGTRALLRNVEMGSGLATRAAAQGNRALSVYDRAVLPASTKYLSSQFEKARR